MAGEGEEERDLDDWFGKSEPLSEEDFFPRREGDLGGMLDDWLQEPPRSPRRKRSVRLEKRSLVALATILCLLLLVGLVAGGVFSGGSTRPRAGPAESTEALTTSPATTAFTPPQPPLPVAKLARGARGPQVIELQRALQRLGYYSERIDGQYGSGTESAVSRFQSASGLTPDGVFGPVTRRALKSALAR
jgi:Putative peptidoglycan binding domain